MTKVILPKSYVLSNERETFKYVLEKYEHIKGFSSIVYKPNVLETLGKRRFRIKWYKMPSSVGLSLFEYSIITWIFWKRHTNLSFSGFSTIGDFEALINDFGLIKLDSIKVYAYAYIPPIANQRLLKRNVIALMKMCSLDSTIAKAVSDLASEIRRRGKVKVKRNRVVIEGVNSKIVSVTPPAWTAIGNAFMKVSNSDIALVAAYDAINNFNYVMPRLVDNLKGET